MAIGNPITLTGNVASKSVTVTATAGQTAFTVTGGYRINQLEVYRNGVRLVDGTDFLARDGATVTLLGAANLNDVVEFQVFNDFSIADAIVSDASNQTIRGNVDVAGILTASTLSISDFDVGDNLTVGTGATIGTGVTIYGNSGIVSATSFFGDGSNLEGVASAGLGTALDSDTAGLDVIYYTNNILDINTSITVDPPTSTNVAYTQYADINVADSVDLIIADGDDLIPDILGLSTAGITPLTGAGGRIRAGFFTNKAGTGAPQLTFGAEVPVGDGITGAGSVNLTGIVTATSLSVVDSTVTGGINATGVITAASGSFSGSVSAASGSFSGNVSVGGVLTYEDVTNVDSLGIVTARNGLRVTQGGINVTAGISTFGGNITSSGSITDDKGDLRTIPASTKSSGYVLVAADTGKVIYISTGGVTINNSVHSGGDVISIINNSGSDQTITQGSGLTLYNTADASTGNKTLAGRGMATVWFASASIAYISGSGLS